ncbi:MAG: FGGY-family carbohydrate kinase [Candidatus Helarchaeota archaeon]
MSDEFLMAVDAGTGGSRCIIFDTLGNRIAFEYDEWKFIDRSDDIGMMAKEFRPDEFWEKIVISIRRAIQNSGINPNKIRAISSTSFREGIILLDENGNELYGGPADDMRGLSIGMDLYRAYGEKIYNITGKIPPFIFATSRLLWFKEKEPEIYKKIRMLLMMNDWILYKLSGVYSTEPSAACETEILDVRKREWSKEIINLLELPENIYPPIFKAGTQIGEITKKVADLTGLIEGTPVVVGGADSECGLLGMGLINHGDIGIIAGTTTAIMMVLDKPLLPSNKAWTNCHLIPNKWNIELNAGPSGKILRWLRDTLAIKEKELAENSELNAFQLMDKLIKTVPPGSNSTFSFLGPLICDWSNLGPLGMGGFLIPLPIDLDKNFAKAQILRSYFENMAYVLKLNCNQIEQITGIKINEISISGGLSNSMEYNDIVVNTLNFPLKIYNETETTGLGASMCAGIGSGIFKDFKDAINTMVRVNKILNIDKDRARIYRKGLKKWNKFNKILQKLN